MEEPGITQSHQRTVEIYSFIAVNQAGSEFFFFFSKIASLGDSNWFFLSQGHIYWQEVQGEVGKGIKSPGNIIAFNDLRPASSPASVSLLSLCLVTPGGLRATAAPFGVTGCVSSSCVLLLRSLRNASPSSVTKLEISMQRASVISVLRRIVLPRAKGFRLKLPVIRGAVF